MQMHTYAKIGANATDSFTALADEIERDPAIKALRLRLRASRNLATRTAKAAHRPTLAPPLPPRRRCYRTHRATASAEDAPCH